LRELLFDGSEWNPTLSSAGASSANQACTFLPVVVLRVCLAEKGLLWKL
jgi:hypothetical protein